jgi:D-arabinose 1-dehydrogenase-like Zn-dependent alcohol dehydrogenase
MADTMRAVQVTEKGGDFELVERDVPTPGPGDVLVEVEACGVCHSDLFAKEGVFPGVSYPVVPGHEVAGRVAALGDGVHGWSEGARVASAGSPATAAGASRVGADSSSRARTWASPA